MSTSSTVSTKLLYTIGVSLSVTLVSALSYWYYKYTKKDVMPEKWRRVGTLDVINLFPIKSCAPLKLSPFTEVDCEVLGLRLDGFRDRALMIVDENDKMITARVYPQMVLIKTEKIGPTKMLITAPNMPPLELDFATLVRNGTIKDIHTAVWGVELDAMLIGEKYDKWFSQCIRNKDSSLKVVYFPYPEPVRKINPRMLKEPFITREDTGTFNDATSYMLMNLSSVDELNTRLQRPVDTLQFRGNFHLKMDIDEPYAEDNWGWIKIGDKAVFRNISPCTRCIFPNINVDTAERDPDGEPLKTLNKYRKWEKYSSPAMGIHLGIREPGSVRVNDVVYVEDK